MSWLDRLERAFGRWTIPQFPLFIVVATGVIYLLSQANPEFGYRLLLDPEEIRAGQPWRLITFLFVPPSMSPLWLLLWLYLIYQYATALEQEWGEFKFLLFYGLGAAATVITSLFIIHEPLGNMALYTTLILAFAALFPDFELLLFFILPIKVKYLGWFLWLITAWAFFTGDWGTRAGILASLFNFALFFGSDMIGWIRLKVEVYKNRKRFWGD